MSGLKIVYSDGSSKTFPAVYAWKTHGKHLIGIDEAGTEVVNQYNVEMVSQTTAALDGDPEGFRQTPTHEQRRAAYIMRFERRCGDDSPHFEQYREWVAQMRDADEGHLDQILDAEFDLVGDASA
ncbi:hypothetical protein HG717_35055 [Rhodococcus erythropolis]|uniref:hypothetical protein n=1 Tax=Rhodococcus TaxID=1827 RepID=UPI0015F68AE6|nr:MULTISPECIES: hypothetical protein [Rhodococcus]MBY6389087.1 hypothetical protein [Rhodococcus erythropolis]